MPNAIGRRARSGLHRRVASNSAPSTTCRGRNMHLSRTAGVPTDRRAVVFDGVHRRVLWSPRCGAFGHVAHGARPFVQLPRARAGHFRGPPLPDCARCGFGCRHRHEAMRKSLLGDFLSAMESGALEAAVAELQAEVRPQSRQVRLFISLLGGGGGHGWGTARASTATKRRACVCVGGCHPLPDRRHAPNLVL